MHGSFTSKRPSESLMARALSEKKTAPSFIKKYFNIVLGVKAIHFDHKSGPGEF